MFRLGILYQDGTIEGLNFNTKDEAETYILSSKKEIKRADLQDKETGERENIYKI